MWPRLNSDCDLSVASPGARAGVLSEPSLITLCRLQTVQDLPWCTW